MPNSDWYCEEVIPGRSSVEVLLDTPEVLAIRPDRPGFGTEHIIVVPKVHVASVLDLKLELASRLLQAVQTISREVCDRLGGCQLVVSVGSEQHNKHLHIHIAAGDGVARFVSRDQPAED